MGRVKKSPKPRLRALKEGYIGTIITAYILWRQMQVTKVTGFSRAIKHDSPNNDALA
jgi:hypothetical protein